ncbi:MAG: hypothetical protein NT091_03395 [Candidatus Falkowbacteria bacterium]|nr:hypothetical protein [Candidatus Falkowbacteria bacterium]
MRQFTIPQFIDTEDKIMGPLTVRQFLIMLTCSMVEFIYFKVFDFTLFVVAGLINLALFGILAFTRINGRPFHFFILNVIQTFRKPGLRVWNNALVDAGPEDFALEIEQLDYIPVASKPMNSSRLTKLSLIVDTSGEFKDINNK